MTDTTSRVPTARTTHHPEPPAPTGWTAWVVFGATILILVGSFQLIEGFTALFRHTYYQVGHNDLLVRVDYTQWGWIHIILGALMVAAGLGLFTGRMWARVVAIMLAGLSALANLVFIAAYPLWALTIIFLDIVVIYAVAVHGREMRAADSY